MHPPHGIVQVCSIHLPKQDRRRWLSVLTAEELARMRRFHQIEDRDRFAVTRGVLRTLLRERTGEGPVFRLGEHEKPYLADSTLYFNVSHSGDYGLIAIADDIEIGVDVERISDHRIVSELAKRVLSAGEYREFTALETAERKLTFFQIWAMKEAVMKGLGTGISLGPEKIEVAFYPREPRVLSCPIEEGRWAVQLLDIRDAGYAAAIATRRTAPIQIEWIEVPA